MPRRPPRVGRHQRGGSDVSPANAPQDGPSTNGHRQTSVKTAVDGLKSDDSRSGESLKGPAGLGSKTFASPVAVSPSNTGVLAPTNTRRIGSKFCMELVKGLLTHRHVVIECCL